MVGAVAVVEVLCKVVELDFDPLPPHAAGPIASSTMLRIAGSVGLERRMNNVGLLDSSMVAVNRRHSTDRRHPRNVRAFRVRNY